MIYVRDDHRPAAEQGRAHQRVMKQAAAIREKRDELFWLLRGGKRKEATTGTAAE